MHTTRRRRYAAVTLAASIALVGAGCTNPTSAPDDTQHSPEAEAETADSGQTITLAETNEYSTLNPLDYMFGITSKVYDGLYTVAADGTMTPNLATAAPEHDDTMTQWTVTLHDDVVFTDGTTLDSEDVVATYRAILDPDYGSPLAGTFAHVATVAAPDASTVEFTLSEPYAAFPSTLTVGIAPAEHLTGTVIDSPLNREPVGSGPYRLETWRSGDSLSLVASDTYRGQRPDVTRLVIAFVPDENARSQRLRAGDFDGAQLSPRSAAALDGVDGLSVFTNTTADYRAITLPPGVEAFTDPKVRLALNLAVDRQAMVDGILRGYGRATATPFTEVQGDAFNSGATYTQNVDQAATLLDAAGWVMGEDGQRAKAGRPLAFDLMYFAEDTLRRDLALAFASDLSALGVDVNVEAVDRPAAVAGMNTKAFVLGGGDQPYDPDTQAYSMLHSQFAAYDPGNAYANPSGYSNGTVDGLLDMARRTADPATRAVAYQQVQDVLIEDPPMVTLVALDHTYVARDLDAFTGVEHVVEPHEHGVAWGPWWNISEWRTAAQ